MEESSRIADKDEAENPKFTENTSYEPSVTVSIISRSELESGTDEVAATPAVREGEEEA